MDYKKVTRVSDLKVKQKKAIILTRQKVITPWDKPAHDLEPVKHFKNKMSHRFHCFVVANPPIN